MAKIPITIDIADTTLTQIAELVDGNAPEAHKLQEYLNLVTRELSGGALILSGNDMSRLRDIDAELDGPEEIIAACAKSKNVNREHGLLKYPRDESVLIAMRERAAINGANVENFMQDIMDYAIAQGWFYDLNAEQRFVFFSRKEETRIRNLFDMTSGQDFDAQMIIKALSEWSRLKQEPEPVLELAPVAVAAIAAPAADGDDLEDL